jgi:hypothetical protein
MAQNVPTLPTPTLDWETKKLLAEDKDIIPVVFAEKVPDRLANKNPVRIKPGESADRLPTALWR